MAPDSVIEFWFEQIDSSQHFQEDRAFDQLVRDRFGALHRSASHGELYSWREQPSGALAEVIVLDQFSRNLFRGSAEAFSCDSMALVLAQEALRRNLDKTMEVRHRCFLYMPFMHSESRQIHKLALALFDQPGLEKNYRFEVRHKEIIDRFGRYPHRNALLGRESTAEELAFLGESGRGF